MGLLFKWDLCQVILHFMFLNKWCCFARDCRVFTHKGLYFQHLRMTGFCVLFGQTSSTLKQQIRWMNYLTKLICPLLENCCIGVVSILLVVTAWKLSSKSCGLVRTVTLIILLKRSCLNLNSSLFCPFFQVFCYFSLTIRCDWLLNWNME